MEIIELICRSECQPQVELINDSERVIGLPWTVFGQISALVQDSQQLGHCEISWIGKVNEHQLGQLGYWYEIEEIRLLKQRSSPTSTTLDPVEIGRVAQEWIEENKGRDNPLRFWGHTHAPYMGVDPSDQDERQMAQLGRGDLAPPFFIRGIFSGQPAKAHTDRWTTVADGRVQMVRFKAEFTLFDYRRGIKIRPVRWGLINGTGDSFSHEWKGLVEKESGRDGIWLTDGDATMAVTRGKLGTETKTAKKSGEGKRRPTDGQRR